MKPKTKVILALVLVFVVLPVVGVFLKVVLFPFFAVEQAIDSAYDITEKTLDADNVIYNYEWFKQQVEDIKAGENKRRTAKQRAISFREFAGDRSEWTFEDKNEYNRLQAVWQGLNNHLEDMIATYNARSGMANRSIFKEGLIPEVMEFVAGAIN